jgi:hypothetical protein
MMAWGSSRTATPRGNWNRTRPREQAEEVGGGHAGVAVGHGRLVDSVVTGNNGYAQGIDILTVKRPRLIATTCGKSVMALSNPGRPGAPWGVCANDSQKSPRSFDVAE